MKLAELYQFFWMLESHSQQRLSWNDAAQARIARDRAERQAMERLQAMLTAHPSGSLGNAALDNEDELRKAGLL